jgi:hypothetical protein
LTVNADPLVGVPVTEAKNLVGFMDLAITLAACSVC